MAKFEEPDEDPCDRALRLAGVTEEQLIADLSALGPLMALGAFRAVALETPFPGVEHDEGVTPT